MRKHRRKEKLVTGIAWYRPEQWQRLREVSVDVETLERNHAEWLAIANKALNDLERGGVSVLKVDVDVEELLTWCGQRGLPVDARSRASFTEHKLHQMNETKH
jgi:hypothetical protein